MPKPSDLPWTRHQRENGYVEINNASGLLMLLLDDEVLAARILRAVNGDYDSHMELRQAQAGIAEALVQLTRAAKCVDTIVAALAKGEPCSDKAEPPKA